MIIFNSSETYCEGSDMSGGEGWYCCSCNCEDFNDAECLESEYNDGSCDLNCDDDTPECIYDCPDFDLIDNNRSASLQMI